MAVERIPQSVTKRFLLKAYLSSDHVTAATGKTIAVVLSQNGAAFGNPSAGATNATEIGSGWYYFDASTTDTGTAGPLILRGTASGVDDVERTYHVVNAHNAGFDGVPAAVAGANGGLPLGDASGRVDLGKWIGSAPNALQAGRMDSYLGAVAAGVIAAASFAANALDAVWSTASRLLTAGTNIVLAKDAGITGFNDLSAAQVNAEADTALADVGVTGTITGRIDAAISSRSSHSAADVAAAVTTDHGAGSYIRNTEPPASVAIAAQVRTELTTELAHLDADVSSRLASGSYTAPANASIAAIKAKTDNLPSDPADASDVAAAFSSLAAGVAAVDADVLAVKAKTDALPGSPAATGDVPSALTIATAVRTELATELARIDVALSTLSTYDGSDPAGVVTLLTRLSDARATLLDNLLNLDAAISSIVITLSTAERNALADAYLDRVDGIEPGMTPRAGFRLMSAAALGLASGMDADPPAPKFRDTNNTKDRIAAVCDEFGNRLSVTLDAS